RVDTAEYEACCKEKECGYGFVSALVYGSGEYATAEEAVGAASANVSIVRAEGTASFKVLHRRGVRGWVAALLRVTNPSKAPGGKLGALGDPSAYGISLDADTLPAQVKSRYDAEQVSIIDHGSSWAFSRGGASLSENDFATSYTALTSSADLDGVKH